MLLAHLLSRCVTVSTGCGSGTTDRLQNTVHIKSQIKI